MISDHKPGVIGAVGNLGQAVKQGVQKEVEKTVKNTFEQLTGKEHESSPDTAAAQAAAEAQRKQQSQDVTNWLYGTPAESNSAPAETLPAPVQAEPKPQGNAIDIKSQLGFGEKPQHTENLAGQLGLKPDTVSHTTTSINPAEQIASQLNMNPTVEKTPEEQQKLAQLKQQLHNEYYQKLTTPQKPPETEERMKEAQAEQETKEQRMQRLEQEDLKKKQEKAEKQQPLDVANAQNFEKNRGSSG